LVTDDTDLHVEGHRVLISVDQPVAMLPWIAAAEQRLAASQFDDLAYSEPFYLKAAYTTQSKK